MPTNKSISEIRKSYEDNKRKHINALVEEYRDIYNSVSSNQEMTTEQDARIIEIIATIRSYRDGEE
tara:strand:+ start:360 stop:557 length:198 start_codon:yes stop_codon:yes gene_type:complete